MSKRLEEAGFEPANARVVLEMTVTMEVGGWGPDCTVGEAVDRSVRDAKNRLTFLLEGKGIYVSHARFARVVCDTRKTK